MAELNLYHIADSVLGYFGPESKSSYSACIIAHAAARAGLRGELANIVGKDLLTHTLAYREALRYSTPRYKDVELQRLKALPKTPTQKTKTTKKDLQHLFSRVSKIRVVPGMVGQAAPNPPPLPETKVVTRPVRGRRGLPPARKDFLFAQCGAILHHMTQKLGIEPTAITGKGKSKKSMIFRSLFAHLCLRLVKDAQGDPISLSELGRYLERKEPNEVLKEANSAQKYWTKMALAIHRQEFEKTVMRIRGAQNNDSASP
jgi:hypothetical protein